MPLSQALHYAGNDAKTTLPESAKLVSGIHCRPETAWADMRAVQRKFGKTEGVVAMHAYQSFQPGEVTPEQCHAIGVELARQVWGGRFQVLVATHMNTHCLHNHFVINAVSYVDGKKYEQRRSQYRELRRASDALCRAQGLSVVQPQGKSTPRPLYEAERRGEPTRYNRMREALRTALQQTSTEEDFALALRRMGYLWRREEGRKYATLRSVDDGRPVRVHRLGPEFDWPALARVLDAHYYQFGPHYYSLFGGYDRPRRPPLPFLGQSAVQRPAGRALRKTPPGPEVSLLPVQGTGQAEFPGVHQLAGDRSDLAQRGAHVGGDAPLL